MESTIIEISQEQFELLLQAIYGISQRLNTIITDGQNYFYFALLVIVFYGMTKLIKSIVEPIVIDY